MLKKGLFKNIFQKVNQIFEGRPVDSEATEEGTSPTATTATLPPAPRCRGAWTKSCSRNWKKRSSAPT